MKTGLNVNSMLAAFWPCLLYYYVCGTYISALLNIPGMTQMRFSEAHKGALKSDRRIKEMQFTSDENRKNMERMTDLIDKLQAKTRT